MKCGSFSMSEAVRSLRIILRHLKVLPSHNLGSAPVRHIISQFKHHRDETDSKRVAALRATAHSYATLLTSTAELSRLRGLDTGERLDPRSKIRQSASRVGLSVPRFADDEQN